MDSAFRRCLIELDVTGIRSLWKETSPGLPQPASDEEALISLHMARTQSRAVPLKLRAYSHRWLLDHNYPSSLPDDLKSKAERMYPTIASAVGISVNASSDLFRPIVPLVQKAMEDSVMDSFANGDSDNSPLIKSRMMEARKDVVKKLLAI